MRARARTALLNERPNAAPCENEKLPPCPPSKFRSPNGECNNIIRRDWGARGDIFHRLLAPSYADGM